MKSLLALLTVMLCSLNAFGQGAQYRPTPFANGFVQTVTSTGTAQTYLGMGSVTNNALLSGTNVFSGTNTFSTNTVFGTNIVGDFVTVGSRYRTIYVGASNYFTGTPSTLETNIYASITLPPLMSEKSQILCGYRTSKTNITTQPVWWWEFRADTTNGTVVAGFGALAAASYWQSSSGPITFVMEHVGLNECFACVAPSRKRRQH